MVAFIPGENGGRKNKEKSPQICEVLLTKCGLVWEIRKVKSPGHREVRTHLPTLSHGTALSPLRCRRFWLSLTASCLRQSRAGELRPSYPRRPVGSALIHAGPRAAEGCGGQQVWTSPMLSSKYLANVLKAGSGNEDENHSECRKRSCGGCELQSQFSFFSL